MVYSLDLCVDRKEHRGQAVLLVSPSRLGGYLLNRRARPSKRKLLRTIHSPQLESIGVRGKRYHFVWDRYPGEYSSSQNKGLYGLSVSKDTAILSSISRNVMYSRKCFGLNVV